MRRYFFLTAFLVLIVLVVIPAMQPGKISLSPQENDPHAAGPPIEIRSKVPGIRLNHCSDDELGVTFLCDFGWERRKVDGIILFTISSDPDATMKIVKIDMDILFIQQLSRDKLKALGRYAKGFVTEEVKVAGLKAIKVKAFAWGDPETRLSDYYFVYNETLYGLMFSVAPKEHWGDYQFLFRDVVNNFQFEGR